MQLFQSLSLYKKEGVEEMRRRLPGRGRSRLCRGLRGSAGARGRVRVSVFYAESRGGRWFRLGPAFQGHFNHVSPCVLGRGTLNVQGNEAASPVRQARLLAPELQCR